LNGFVRYEATEDPVREASTEESDGFGLGVATFDVLAADAADAS